MTKIVLHGELAEKFHNEYDLDVSSAKGAIRALSLMVPEFKSTLQNGSYYLHYEDNGEFFDIDETNFDFHHGKTLHIVPEVLGAKGGIGKIIAGIALIGLTFIPGANVAVLGALSAIPGLGGSALMAAQGLVMAAATKIGTALILGGAAMMLSPKVKNNSTAADSQQSYIFDGSDINIQNGAPVPIIYGEVLAAGFPISVDVTDAETNVTTGNTDYDFAIGGFNGYNYQTYLP